ncbi:MAG: membrane protein insertion efficiency factor YidD [Verrucomicrobiota bacterium]|jgi:putative membrane protein insertion efficiency factor
MARGFLILLIRFYQALISPALGAFFGPAARCRYTPSCSQYARQAIHLHGAFAGGILAAKRLCRCHPWAPTGEDPVPARLPVCKFVDRNIKSPAGHGP